MEDAVWFEGIDGIADNFGMDATNDGFIIARRNDPIHQEFLYIRKDLLAQRLFQTSIIRRRDQPDDLMRGMRRLKSASQKLRR